MKKLACVLIFCCAASLFAAPRLNGPPLFVCEGAVPLEPNADKLPQMYFQDTAWNKPESHTVVTTNEKEFREALKLIGPDVQLPFEKDAIHVIFLNGTVEESKGNGKGVQAPLEVEVFGVERTYIPTSNPEQPADNVFIHIVSRDIGRGVPKHSPGIYYKIRFNQLDTEHNGTPPVTKATTFDVLTVRAKTEYNGHGKLLK